MTTVVKPRPDDDLPTNVATEAQLADVPDECLSGDAVRPLRHIDDRGKVSQYSLQPIRYAVGLILLVELLERFSFYGMYYTQTMYLTGVYDEDWNAGLTSIDASSMVSLSTAMAYTTPFVGAYLSDSLVGDYTAILIGTGALYLPGLVLLCLTSVPGLLSEEFNYAALSIGLLVLWPMGTGIVKSIVNVFGAKQFHPLLQSSMIESYYVAFYQTINVGALAGITTIPVLAQQNVTLAYSIPVMLLSIGILVFLAGTPRYVKTAPHGDLWAKGPSSSISLSTIVRICLLNTAFCIAYSQMPTTFIIQGTVMRRFGIFDAATMNSLDCLSVLIFGHLTGNYLYPALAQRGIKIATTYKFAIGCALAAGAIVWALLVESMIHAAYERDGSQVCVLWQAGSYILIGWGEIFAVSAAYEVAFTASPPEKKVLASAVNIFCIGGLPNLVCILLYQACSGWFRNAKGTTNNQHLSDYATAHVANYFWVLFGILLIGIIVNTLPCVRQFVESVENKAADLLRTPKLTPKLGRAETSPLLGTRDQYYMRFGKRPVLYKMGSMRAGPSLSKPGKSKPVKYKYIPKLYPSSKPIVIPPRRLEHHSSMPNEA